MSVAKGFRLSDNSTAKLDWNYVTKPDGSKTIIEEVNDVKQDLAQVQEFEIYVEGNALVINSNLINGDEVSY